MPGFKIQKLYKNYMWNFHRSKNPLLTSIIFYCILSGVILENVSENNYLIMCLRINQWLQILNGRI